MSVLSLGCERSLRSLSPPSAGWSLAGPTPASVLSLGSERSLRSLSPPSAGWSLAGPTPASGQALATSVLGALSVACSEDAKT
jgi:hypothetical protein